MRTFLRGFCAATARRACVPSQTQRDAPAVTDVEWAVALAREAAAALFASRDIARPDGMADAYAVPGRRPSP